MTTKEIYELFLDKKKEIKNLEEVLEISELGNRTLLLGDVTEEIGDYFAQMIRFFNRADEDIPVALRKPIKIYINSYGGSLTASFLIIDAIKTSKTPVWTIVTGCAYSGGFFTAIAGDRKIGNKHSSYLYHEGSCSNGGDANKFRNFAKFYETQMGMLKTLVLKNTKISEDEYDHHIKDDWWFTAEEALKYGIIDEIAEDIL